MQLRPAHAARSVDDRFDIRDGRGVQLGDGAEGQGYRPRSVDQHRAPPSTLTTAPFTNDAPSPARNSTTEANSSGVPKPRPAGRLRSSIFCRRGWSMCLATSSVMTTPGFTAFTRMARSASESAIALDRAMRPPLAATYASLPGTAWTAPMVPMVRITLPGGISGTSWRALRHGPVRVTALVRLHARGGTPHT